MKRPTNSKYIVFGGFTLLLLMFAFAGTITINHMQQITQQIDKNVTHDNAKSQYVSDMYDAARLRVLVLYSMFLTDDPFFRNEGYEQMSLHASNFMNALGKYKESGLDDYENAELTSALKMIREKSASAQLKAANLLVNEGNYEEATRLVLEEAVPAQNKAISHMINLIKHQRELSEKMVETVGNSYIETRNFVVFLGAVIIGLSALIGIYVIMRISTTENELVLSMQAAEQRSEELSEALENLQATQEKLNSTEEVMHTEKMVALGQLTAGVAHEINTPLGAIRSSVGNISKFLESHLRHLPEAFELHKDHLEKVLTLLEQAVTNHESPSLSSKEERKVRRALTRALEEQGVENADTQAARLIEIGVMESNDEILELLRSDDGAKVLSLVHRLAGINRGLLTIGMASDRAAKVVFALKKFAHYDHSEEKQSADVVENIETVVTLYHNQLKHGIELIKELDDLPPVLCYPDELTQVWTNLLHNSLQAMEYKGTLKIKAVQEEDNVLVSITDSGAGIPENVQENIFKPFFTTKAAGEGSGLGLDIVRKIIEKHKGTIEFSSQPGETTFFVRLPVNATASTEN